MIRTLTISLVTLCLFPIKGRSQAFELRKENDSLYWLGVKGGSKSDEWRIEHPVYQFQTGDVDGDGNEDAMVGVIKKTRFYPMGRRADQTTPNPSYSGGEAAAGVISRHCVYAPQEVSATDVVGIEVGRYSGGLPIR